MTGGSPPLTDLRVLDFSDERGLLCGQLLADLGADVVQVEPPGGSGARRLGPFLDARRDPERSLTWAAYARNKRGITLDLEREVDRTTARELVRRADFAIESSDPVERSRLGLGYQELSRENPALIVVSITAFGLDGPKAQWAASDLVVQAAAGNLLLQGDEDRPPVRVSSPQAFHHAAAEAAFGALIAHTERVRSGRGQHVVVSAQQALLSATQGEALSVAVGDVAGGRAGGGLRLGPFRMRFTYPAKDGYVSIMHAFGPAFGAATARLMAWMAESGECSAELRDTDWVGFGARMFRGEATPDELLEAQARVAASTSKRSKQELSRLALERKLLLAPAATLADLLASEHFEKRASFWRTEQAGVPVTLPGPFARLSRTPLRSRRGAPRIGEHDAEVRREWLASPPRAGQPPAASSKEACSKPALADLKVLDFSWAIAGPTAGRTLADFGATVVRVESARKLCPNRSVRPFLGGRFGGERSTLFHNMNAGKLQLGLDLTKPGAKDVALDLVRWADVVVESFVPGALARMGLGYDVLRAAKPDVILVSSSLLGQTGPLSSLAGYGNLGAALAGFLELTGWPDRAPVGPYAAYTDYIAPRFTGAVLLAALDHRRRTGEGQHIDLAQVETGLHLLAPLIAETSATGRVATRRGNEDPDCCPHGVYPVAGEDRWIALAIASDAEWRALCAVLGLPGEAALLNVEQRRARTATLDAEISRATAAWAGEKLEAALQERGVPAHRLQDSADLSADPQLQHLGHFVEIEHPNEGRAVVEACRIRLSRTPARPPRVAPTLGADNQRVLEEILRYDAERIAKLAIDQVLD